MNTSTRTVVRPIEAGLSNPPLVGSWRKNGAPSISRPTTPPRLHSTEAPRARWYHALAVGDYFTILELGQVTAAFAKGTKTDDEAETLMAGGKRGLALIDEAVAEVPDI